MALENNTLFSLLYITLCLLANLIKTLVPLKTIKSSEPPGTVYQLYTVKTLMEMCEASKIKTEINVDDLF